MIFDKYYLIVLLSYVVHNTSFEVGMTEFWFINQMFDV